MCNLKITSSVAAHNTNVNNLDKHKSNDMPHIILTKLPTEILQKIIQYVLQNDKFSTIFVCQKFMDNALIVLNLPKNNNLKHNMFRRLNNAIVTIAFKPLNLHKNSIIKLPDNRKKIQMQKMLEFKDYIKFMVNLDIIPVKLIEAEVLIKFCQFLVTRTSENPLTLDFTGAKFENNKIEQAIDIIIKNKIDIHSIKFDKIIKLSSLALEKLEFYLKDNPNFFKED